MWEACPRMAMRSWTLWFHRDDFCNFVDSFQLVASWVIDGTVKSKGKWVHESFSLDKGQWGV